MLYLNPLSFHFNKLYILTSFSTSRVRLHRRKFRLVPYCESVYLPTLFILKVPDEKVTFYSGIHCPLPVFYNEDSQFFDSLLYFH